MAVRATNARRRWTVAGALVVLLAAATVVSAQRGQGGRRNGGGGGGGFGGFGRLPEGRAVPPRYAPKQFEDGAFTVCKIEFTSVTREPMGAGWSTDYPYAGINLMTRLSELTKTSISKDDQGNPNYWVVRLTDPELFRCPFTMGSDVGTMGLSDQEAERLGAYLLKGGFLWVDDFWGTPGWNQWAGEIHKALPGYPIVDVPPEHALRTLMFRMDTIPQVTNINNWLRTHDTRERGDDSPYADFRMISDERGRAMVVMTHNTDVADSWEREAEDHDFFLRFSPPGYQLGMDVLLYSMTH